jgi:hypothetical protein
VASRKRLWVNIMKQHADRGILPARNAIDNKKGSVCKHR